MLHIANNIKTIRQLLNLTQAEFAKKFSVKNKKGGYSADKIYTYEQGLAEPSELLIREIADYLGIDPNALKNKALTKKDIQLKEIDNLLHDDSGEHLDERNNSSAQSKPITEADMLREKDERIKELKEQLTWIKSIIDANLKMADSDREMMMIQLRNLTILSAEIYAGGDKKKYESKMAEYRKALGADGSAKT